MQEKIDSDHLQKVQDHLLKEEQKKYNEGGKNDQTIQEIKKAQPENPKNTANISTMVHKSYDTPNIQTKSHISGDTMVRYIIYISYLVLGILMVKFVIRAVKLRIHKKQIAIGSSFVTEKSYHAKGYQEELEREVFIKKTKGVDTPTHKDTDFSFYGNKKKNNIQITEIKRSVEKNNKKNDTSVLFEDSDFF